MNKTPAPPPSAFSSGAAASNAHFAELVRNPRPSHLAGTVPIGSASVPPLSEVDAVAHQRKLWEDELERYNNAAAAKAKEIDDFIMGNFSADRKQVAAIAKDTMDTYPTRTNDSATAPAKRAPDYLDDAAAVYRQRNKVYGDNYRKFGHMMLAMYPDGLTLKTADDFNRLGVFVQCLAKVSRYAETLPQGGHPDSALDLATYAAMLRELTRDGE